MRVNTLRLIAALAMMFVGSVASAQVSVGGVGVGAGGAGSVGGGAIGPGVGGAGSAAGAVGNATGVTGAGTGQVGAGTVNGAGAAAGSVQRSGVTGATNGATQVTGQNGVSGAGQAAGQVGRGTTNVGSNGAVQSANGVVNGAGNAAGTVTGNNNGLNGAANAAGAATGQAGNQNAGINGATSAAANATRSLGVNVREAQNGLTVTNLNAGGLGQLAGLRNGDRIVSLDGTPIRSHQELVSAIRGGTAPTGNLSIVRNGVTQQIPLNWGSGSLQTQGATSTAQQVTAGFRGLNDGVTFTSVGNSLQVGQVTNGTWAHRSGLMSNDRIIALNGIPVTSQSQLTTALQNAASQNGNAQMIVNRAGRQEVLQLQLPRESINGNAAGALNSTTEGAVNGAAGRNGVNGAVNNATGAAGNADVNGTNGAINAAGNAASKASGSTNTTVPSVNK